MENMENKTETTPEKVEKKSGTLEMIIVIMLGITALLTAWATWVGSMHGANQSANYAISSNLSAEGNAEYNAGIQNMMSDMMLYNQLNGLIIDQYFAEEQGDEDTYEAIEYKLEQLMPHMSEEFAVAFEWAWEQLEITEESVSPFENEEYAASFFIEANEKLEEAEKAMVQGDKDSSTSDKFGLVTVLYTVALFMLGITSNFKVFKNKAIVFATASVAFLIGTIYMLTLPMPVGFNIASFFGG